MKKPSFEQFATRDDYVKFWYYQHLGWRVHLLPDADGQIRFLAASEPRVK